MTTKRMVTYLAKRVGAKWGRDEIREVINDITQYLNARHLLQMQPVNSATGDPNFLVTVEGQARYTFPGNTYQDANGKNLIVARTIAVLTRDLLRNYSVRNFFARPRSYFFQTREYKEVQVTSLDKIEGRDAELTFSLELRDPETTNDKFFHLFQREQPELVSDNIELLFPASTHIPIRDGALFVMREESYGGMSGFEYWRRKYAPIIVYEMNQGAQGQLKQTPIREEFREYGLFYNYKS